MYLSAPTMPSIDWSDRLTALVVNQTSVTFRGDQISSSSDTFGSHYAIYYPSGSPVWSVLNNPPFANSSGNLTIGNLTAGNGYRFYLISAIGTTTPCGGQLVYSVGISIFFCTGNPTYFVKKSIRFIHRAPDSNALIVKTARFNELNEILLDSSWF